MSKKLSQRRNKILYTDAEGNCFQDFETFCSRNNLILNKLLLADLDQGFEAGQAWENINIVTKNRSRGPVKEFLLIKKDLLQGQIDHIVALHSESEKINLYFFDDRDDILAFLSTAGVLHYPKNIRLHLIKFDWYLHLENKEPMQEIFTS